MFRYVRLNSKNNAKNALREILANKASKSNLMFVVYDIGENHVLCASDEGGPSAVRKYELSGDTCRAMRSDSPNGNFAVLAYNMADNEVYLLDTVPEAQIASCVLLCVMNILTQEACTHTYMATREDVSNYVTAQPRKPTKVVRDSETGRFMRLEEDASIFNDEPSIGGGFRLRRLH